MDIVKYIDDCAQPEQYVMSDEDNAMLESLDERLGTLTSEESKKLNYLSAKSYIQELHENPSECEIEEECYEILNGRKRGISFDIGLMTNQIDSNPFIDIYKNSKKNKVLHQRII